MIPPIGIAPGHETHVCKPGYSQGPNPELEVGGVKHHSYGWVVLVMVVIVTEGRGKVVQT